MLQLNVFLVFLRQKLGTKLTKSDWARLIARAQHFASFYYGHACGSAADQCLYSAYDIKEMMFRDGTRNFLASGYLSFQQYEVNKFNYIDMRNRLKSVQF